MFEITPSTQEFSLRSVAQHAPTAHVDKLGGIPYLYFHRVSPPHQLLPPTERKLLGWAADRLGWHRLRSGVDAML